MALLSSRNGKFYEIPDKDLAKFELPADKVKEVLSGMEHEGGGDVEPYGYGGPAQVIIHVNGSGATVESGPPEGEGEGVQPYGYYGGGYGGYYPPPYWGWRRRRRRHYYYGY